MKHAKDIALFSIGGSAYVGLELLWRGRSHVSMFGAGGLCFLLLGKLGKLRLPWPVQAAAGSGIITAVELGTGLIVNRDHRVWDYRDVPGNFRGQICPMFMALWVPVAAMGCALYDWSEKNVDRLLKSHPSGSVPAAGWQPE